MASFFDYPTDPQRAPIQDQPFLAHWHNQEWNKLFALTQTYRYSPGDWVVQAGDTDRAFYLVTFGQLETIGAPSTGRKRVATIDPGGLVGMQTFLDGQPQPVAVRAATEAEAVRLSVDAFEIFAAREPALARDLVWALGCALSIELRRLQTRMTE